MLGVAYIYSVRLWFHWTRKSTNTIYIGYIVYCQQCLCSFYGLLYFHSNSAELAFSCLPKRTTWYFKSLKILRTYLFYRKECRKHKYKLISFKAMASTRQRDSEWRRVFQSLKVYAWDLCHRYRQQLGPPNNQQFSVRICVFIMVALGCVRTRKQMLPKFDASVISFAQ